MIDFDGIEFKIKKNTSKIKIHNHESFKIKTICANCKSGDLIDVRKILHKTGMDYDVKVFIKEDFNNSNPHFYYNIRSEYREEMFGFSLFHVNCAILDCTLRLSFWKELLRIIGCTTTTVMEDQKEYDNPFDNCFVTSLFFREWRETVVAIRYNLGNEERIERFDPNYIFDKFNLSNENGLCMYFKTYNCVLIFKKISEASEYFVWKERIKIQSEIECFSKNLKF